MGVAFALCPLSPDAQELSRRHDTHPFAAVARVVSQVASYEVVRPTGESRCQEGLICRVRQGRLEWGRRHDEPKRHHVCQQTSDVRFLKVESRTAQDSAILGKDPAVVTEVQYAR